MTDQMTEMIGNMKKKRKSQLMGAKKRKTTKCGCSRRGKSKDFGDDMMGMTKGVVKTGVGVLAGVTLLNAMGNIANNQ
jgi:hypothetical protein